MYQRVSFKGGVLSYSPMNSTQREGIALLFVRGKVQQRSTKLTPRLDSVSLAVVRSPLVLGVLFDMVDNRESAYCILPFLSGSPANLVAPEPRERVFYRNSITCHEVENAWYARLHGYLHPSSVD